MEEAKIEMNGSRPHISRSGTPSHGGGERSSLDALNRTIEGLESRLDGLMGNGAREPKYRAPEREPRPDPVSEIMQRQRALAASRDAAPDRGDRYAAPSRQPASPSYSEERRTSPLREALAQRNMAQREAVPYRAPLREPARENFSRPAEPRQDMAIAEITQALLGLRKELKADIADGLTREMAALRNEIRGITAEASQGQVGLADIRGDLQWLSESISQLGRQAPPAQADALKVEFDELRALIEGLSRDDSMRRMEDRWSAVEDRLQHFDANRDDELVALAYRLDEIKSQIGGINSTPAIHALEDKLMSMAQAVEMLGRHLQPDDNRLASRFADLDMRLDEISRAIVSSGRTASSLDAAAVDRVEHRIADLAQQIDMMARPADNGLSNRIEALAMRVEQLANEEAAVRLEERLDQLSLMFERSQENIQPDLTNYLADISRKIDALDQGDVNDALAERLDDLARRIDALDTPTQAYPMGDRFTRLEDRLADIAVRLEETHAAPYDDSAALRSLQEQISNLSALVSEPRPVAAAANLPVEFEGRMSALEDYLATSDEYIIEAARQAAEAVMEAYQRSGAAPAAAGGDLAAISALAGDLKALEELTRSSEERTVRTFDALHETLVHIAEKLERLEDGGTKPEAPRPFGTRDAGFVPPRMPRAAEPDFEDPFMQAEEPDPLKRDMREQASSVSPSALMQAAVDEDVATALREEEDIADDSVVTTESRPVARKSLLAGLARRFSGKRNQVVHAESRQTVEPTPSIDAADMIAPDVANQLLEPGSGMPDVKKILERVRAGQAGRGGQDIAAGDADKADFIAAARRAAQLAVEESDTIGQRARVVAPKPSIGGAFARHRRPILMAVGAVLLAIMSYPLVNTLIRGEKAPAVIEQQVEAPAAEDATNAAATPAEEAVAPLSSLQPQDGDLDAAASEESTEPVQAAEPADAGLATANPEAVTTAAATGQSALPVTELMSPSSQTATAGSFAETPVQTAGTDEFSTPAKPVEAVEVPAAITQPALVAAIKSGDPLAYFEVGAIYTEGRGVKANLVEAAKWYQRAADQGLVPAEYRLATLYEQGTGVARDAAKAKALYLGAAEKGNASAMHNLAVMLANGGDAAPDFTEAGKWFVKAAELGLRDSQYNLAILFARGNGVKQDLVESYKWFAVAAKSGDTDAAQKREDVAKAMKPEQLKDAKARFEAWKPAVADEKANDVIVPDAWLGKSPSTATVDMTKAIRNIQAILNNNGFDAGTPDGKIGAKTTEAIKAFQKSIGQEPTGQINDALVRELLKRNG